MSDEPQPLSFSLEGRVALVTGAGTGIGRSLCNGFADFGAQVVATDLDGESAEETAELIRARGASATAAVLDVADRESVDNAFRTVVADQGGIDVLVNNAGIATKPARVHEMTVEDWDRLIEINLRGTFLCMRAALPAMLHAGRGSIINLSSIAGLVGFHPDVLSASNYCTSKAGLIGLTRQAAIEYAPDGIRVNAIAPGFHGGTRLGQETDFGANTPAEFETAVTEWVGNTEKWIPMGRFAVPDDLRGLAVYLASDASSYVTGQVIAQDGGWTVW